jgi:RNA polymerase sigma-70 factor (ECF subfamily)
MAASRASDARAAVDRSFEQLYRGHHADVFRAALRELGNVHDAEDVTQAAFVDAYRAVLRGSRPEAPRAWLLAIAENVRRRRYRTSLRRPREEPIDADFPLAAELPHELAHTLAEALAELPPEQRRVFVLRELGGLSYDEIADELGSTVGAIQMLLFRARRSLRERLEPPTVARRRAGLVLPVPAWLATLVSRADVSLLTPRAAGAAAAGVVAVVGAVVTTEKVPADLVPRPDAAPPPALVSPAGSAAAGPVPTARVVAARRQVVPHAAPTTRPVRTPAPPASTPVAVARRPAVVRPVPAFTTATATEVAAPVPASQPVANAAAPQPAPTLPALEPPPSPVRALDDQAERLLEAPVPLSTAPVLEAAPVVEAVTGAAGAAGAGAPPLPVPGVPPVTVPPAP